MKYAAFLRGINVGGNRILKMDGIKKTFESLGFRDVKTILASGNVIFDAPKGETDALAAKIGDGLKKTTGHEIGVIVRTIGELEALSAADPFKGITVTPETRLYITFLSEKPKGSLKIPYESPGGNFRIITAGKKEVIGVLTLSQEGRTVDLMDILEKEFGKKVTTRNWNTIARILKASGE